MEFFRRGKRKPPTFASFKNFLWPRGPNIGEDSFSICLSLIGYLIRTPVFRLATSPSVKAACVLIGCNTRSGGPPFRVDIFSVPRFRESRALTDGGGKGGTLFSIESSSAPKKLPKHTYVRGISRLSKVWNIGVGASHGSVYFGRDVCVAAGLCRPLIGY